MSLLTLESTQYIWDIYYFWAANWRLHLSCFKSSKQSEKTKQWFVKQQDWKRHLFQALFCGEMIQLKVYFNNSDVQEDEFRILFLEVFYSISGCYHSFNLWSIQPVWDIDKNFGDHAPDSQRHESYFKYQIFCSLSAPQSCGEYGERKTRKKNITGKGWNALKHQHFDATYLKAAEVLILRIVGLFNPFFDRTH